MEQILIIEDDISLNQGLSRALKSDDIRVISCLKLGEARQQLLLGEVSLVILDINLPDGSGLDFIKEIKEALPLCPVILLTANDTDTEIVEGLDRGADDYVTKPFSLSVLRARVNARLRKSALSHTPAKSGVFQDERFYFDFDKMTFLAGGESMELSKTEQKLLRILVENRGNTVSRNALIDKIWTGGAEYVDENALSVAVKRLRDKLGAHDYIRTIYGIGYAWGKKSETKPSNIDFD